MKIDDFIYSIQEKYYYTQKHDLTLQTLMLPLYPWAPYAGFLTERVKCYLLFNYLIGISNILIGIPQLEFRVLVGKVIFTQAIFCMSKLS